MLLNPSIDKLQAMHLHGMAKGLTEQLQTDMSGMEFNQRLSLLIDREATYRENKKIATRLKKAKLKQMASLEDVDYQRNRGLDKMMLLKLADCSWVRNHHNILIVGPTGIGKTYLSSALAHKACLEGFSSYYAKISRLLPELIISRGDGSYIKLLNSLAKADVIILDDWGMMQLNAEHRRDLLEILDDRYNRKSTIVTSQIPIKLWHESIHDNTFADAILDRLIHNAYRIELKGDSMRRFKTNLTTEDNK